MPANACVALLCAGWVAGRGPLPRALGRAARAAPPAWRRAAGAAGPPPLAVLAAARS